MSRLIFVFLVIFLIVRFLTFKNLDLPNEKVRITGRISEDPRVYDTSQLIRIDQYSAFVPKWPALFYGDILTIEGIGEKKKLSNAKIISIKEKPQALYRVREQILSFYRKSLPANDAALVAGMAIGAKGLLSRDFYETLKQTGTAHVVVASGMNVMLVGNTVLSILIVFISKKKAILIALLMIWVYTLMSGFQAPVVRAAVMGSIAFSAQRVGRQIVAWRSLTFSALIMLLYKPVWIADLGFILSFVATASIMLFNTKISRLIHFVPTVLREGITTSLSAQIGVAPILWASFGSFNILSPLINSFVLWTVAYITIIGMAAGLISLLIPDIAFYLLLFVYPLTQWFLGIVSFFSQ